MHAATSDTIATMTADSVSRRNAQATSNEPETIQVKMSMVRPAPPSATSQNITMPSTAASDIAPQVTSWAARSPIRRPPRPAMIAPISGRKTIAAYTRSTFHLIDVLDRDGAAVPEIDHQDGEPDRRLGGGDGEDEHREQLPDHVVQEGREGDEVDVDRQQDQLDRHQDDDDVPAIEEDAEDAEREQDRGDRQVVGQADHHHTPSRDGT